MDNASLELKEIIRKERYYVFILATIQIVHTIDFVIMMPLGPQFIRYFNIDPTQFSSLVSSYTFSAGIVGFFGALYADHFDRKKFLLFNFTGFIFGTLLCGLAPNFSSLLIARIIAGAFGGVLNACVLSLVTELIPFERRGRAMGSVMSAFSIASVIGIPAGLYIAQIFNWHATFYFICLLSIIFWIMSYRILPSVKVNREAKGFIENLKSFKSILIQKDYLQAFSLTSVLALGVFSVIPFISPYMVNNVGLLESQLPLIYLVGGVCTVVSARIIGKLCDRIGSFKVFKFLALISIVPILFVTNMPASPLWIALSGTTIFMMFGSGRFIPAMTMVTAVVQTKDRGTFMSLENASRQFWAGVASQIAGLIIGASASGALTNYHVVGYIGTIASVVAIFIASRISHKFNLR